MYVSCSQAGTVFGQLFRRTRSGKLRFQAFVGGRVHPGRNRIDLGPRRALPAARYELTLYEALVGERNFKPRLQRVPFRAGPLR